MKILKLTRTGIAALFASAIMFGFASCESQPDDSKEVAQEQNDVTFEDKDAENDADYLIDAAGILEKNAGLGELAESKATSKEVKDLGSAMAKAHTSDLAELQSLASGKNITLPASPTDNTMDDFEDLNGKSGAEFDKLYCDKVVSNHKDAINHMEAIEKNAVDTDIRVWASRILPHLRSHLASAETIQNSVKDKK
jgi:putative membrane protein